MNIETLMSLIGSLGFPIVMCLIMFNYMEKERESHAKEVDRLTETLQNNTNVLSDLKLLMTQLLASSNIITNERGNKNGN